MMSSRSLSDSPLFTIPEAVLDERGLVQDSSIDHIKVWLEELAADTHARSSVVSQTLDGAVRQNVFRAHDVADAMDSQVQAAEVLHDALESAFSLVLDA